MAVRPERAHVLSTRGRGGPETARVSVAGWIDRQRARRLVSGGSCGRRSTVARPDSARRPVGLRPNRRSRARVDGRTKWAAGLAAYLAAML
jgi:hypothetical protein